MPHFKCVPCKTRLHLPAAPDDLVGDLCPDCGALLEPVGELAEIVGYQSIEASNRVGGSVSVLALAEEIALPRPGENP
jgi:hypothetical protein